MMVELREIFGRLEDEPIPDLGSVPAGNICDSLPHSGPISMRFHFTSLTTATLEALSRKNPGAKFDVRRFRPNLLIETIGKISWTRGGSMVGSNDPHRKGENQTRDADRAMRHDDIADR